MNFAKSNTSVPSHHDAPEGLRRHHRKGALRTGTHKQEDLLTLLNVRFHGYTYSVVRGRCFV